MSGWNRLALFDCDGTLVDSQHSIVEAMRRAFEGAKLAPPDRAAILAIVGLSLPHAMALLYLTYPLWWHRLLTSDGACHVEFVRPLLSQRRSGLRLR